MSRKAFRSLPLSSGKLVPFARDAYKPPAECISPIVVFSLRARNIAEALNAGELDELYTKLSTFALRSALVTPMKSKSNMKQLRQELELARREPAPFNFLHNSPPIAEEYNLLAIASPQMRDQSLLGVDAAVFSPLDLIYDHSLKVMETAYDLVSVTAAGQQLAMLEARQRRYQFLPEMRYVFVPHGAKAEMLSPVPQNRGVLRLPSRIPAR